MKITWPEGVTITKDRLEEYIKIMQEDMKYNATIDAWGFYASELPSIEYK